jgi:hypothetical protein
MKNHSAGPVLLNGGKHLSNGAVRPLYRAATLAFFLQAKTAGSSL